MLYYFPGNDSPDTANHFLAEILIPKRRVGWRGRRGKRVNWDMRDIVREREREREGERKR